MQVMMLNFKEAEYKNADQPAGPKLYLKERNKTINTLCKILA